MVWREDFETTLHEPIGSGASQEKYYIFMEISSLTHFQTQRAKFDAGLLVGSGDLFLSSVK